MDKPLSLSIFFVSALVATASAAAQNFPAKPVRIIVPFAPGGGTDLLARTLAVKLTAAWNQQVVVDNRPGGGTVIGSDLVAKSAPDGHTLLLTANTHTTNPALHAKLPYDTLKDFAGVTQIAAAPMLLTTHPALPVRNVRELIALARAKPGQLAFATSGNAGPQHLAGESFKTLAGISMVHVPYKGSAPAITDLIAGQTQLTFGSTFTVLPHAGTGRLRALAVTTARRVPALNLPTIAEDGLPGYEAATWYGIFSVGGTPAAVIGKLHADIARALKLPDVAERLARDGSDAVASEPAVFDVFIRAEIDKVRRIVKASGMRLD
jgi:tripartite-type tricarboxylate transporter receptor subunit TctC